MKTQLKMFKLKDLPRALTFDDVLVKPSKTQIGSTAADVKTKISKNVEINIPIVSSPMDTVTEERLAIALAREGGIGIIHRNLTLEEEIRIVKKVKGLGLKIGAAIGPFDLKRAKALDKAEADVIMIDCSHGLKLDIIKSAKRIKSSIKTDLVVGSIATKEGARAYADFADGFRVGVGPGSICTMRIVTGVGVPQLTAIAEVAKVAKKHKIPIMADGGIRYSGDIAKAIAVGADSVMLGNLLAGTDEAPGEWVEIEGEKYKRYRGMGSRDAMAKGVVADRYDQEKLKKKISMGVSGLVVYRGSVKELVSQLVGGLKAAMGLVGAKDINQMPRKARLIRITGAGMRESHPHTLKAFVKEPSYQG